MKTCSSMVTLAGLPRAALLAAGIALACASPAVTAQGHGAKSGRVAKSSEAQPAQPDAAVLAARDAFRAGDEKKLVAAAKAAEGHVLEPWVRYYQLRLR